MASGTSLDLFALVWALLCAVASAVVIDTLLKALPRSPGPGDTAGVPAPSAQRPGRRGVPRLRRMASLTPERLGVDHQQRPGVVCMTKSDVHGRSTPLTVPAPCDDVRTRP